MDEKIIFTSKDYSDVLKEQFQIPVKNQELILAKLNNADLIIKEAFLDILAGKKVELIIREVPYSLLVSDLKMTPLAALLTLDWIIREPEKALRSLRKDILRWKKGEMI